MERESVSKMTELSPMARSIPVFIEQFAQNEADFDAKKAGWRCDGDRHVDPGGSVRCY